MEQMELAQDVLLYHVALVMKILREALLDMSSVEHMALSLELEELELEHAWF